MEFITDISDLYDNEVTVECNNGERLTGKLILVEPTYVVIENKRKQMIIFDVKRVLIGG